MDKETYRYLLGECAKYANQRFPQGNFVECGVMPGKSCIILANIFRRKGFFFDTWRGIPDYDPVDAATSEHEFCLRRAKKKVKDKLKYKGSKNYILKSFQRRLKKENIFQFCELIAGDIRITVPKFVEKRKDLEIAFGHIDCNLYRPAEAAISALWDNFVDGSVMYFDDYKDPAWPGIEKAVKEFHDYHTSYLIDFNESHGVNNCILTKGSDEDFTSLLDFLEDISGKNIVYSRSEK